MTHDSPLLSIVIPTYNYAHFLPEALDSLLRQDFPSMEIIVINDGSTDNTDEVIKEYAEKMPSLRYIRYEKNRGIHHVINHSIDLARGTYMHWLAADDFRAPHFVKRSMELLLKNPEIGICCSDCGYVEEARGRNNLLTQPLIKDVKSPLVLKPQDVIKILRSTNFWIPGHTTIVKKESVIRNGRYKENFHEKCDWFLSHQIALQEGIIYIPETLSYWYQHTQSYSSQIAVKEKMRKLVAKEVLDFLNQEENLPLRKKFYQSTLLRWVYKEIPQEFLKIRHLEASFFFALRRIRRYYRILTGRAYLNE